MRVSPGLLLAVLDSHVQALADRLGEILEQRNAVLPADAGIGDALAVYQRFSRNQALASRLVGRFDHEGADAVFAGGDLVGALARDGDLELIHILDVTRT